MTQQHLNTIYQLMRSAQGIAAILQEVRGYAEGPSPLVAPEQLVASPVPLALLNRSGSVRYPVIQVYCERVENSLQEKFVAFSGSLYLAVEVHSTHENLDELAVEMETLTEAVAFFLERHRGEIAEGLFLPGRYDIRFEAPKAGGRQFIQSAKITFPVTLKRS